MSQLSPVGTRQYQAQTPALATQPDAKTRTGTKGDTADALTSRTANDAVSLSKNGLDLSAQGLSDRTDALGNATLDVAQNFLNSFAQNLLGDAAKGASISFDSASISAESGYSALLQRSSGPNGSSTSAAFSLSESSHFIGKGKITTEDGQSFEFEIEVQYESRIEAAGASQSAAAPPATGGTGSGSDGDGDAGALPTLQLPDMAFPGGLSDLFKLLGRQLQGDVADPQNQQTPQAGQDDKAGTLSLRLLNLVNNASLLDAVPPAAQARAKALADAYGAPAVPVATPAPLDTASQQDLADGIKPPAA